MFQDISVEELNELRKKKDIVLIDVRSPSEYQNASIPGSVNLPLFDDAERAEIGTLYTQVSVSAAKDRGLEIASAKLPAFVKAFERIKEDKVVFCWRGGMRSKTTATVLSLMGIRVYRISGGFRDYRRWVVETLAEYELNVPVYVLQGNTGTGKTAILQALRKDGYPVLDLEGMAGHRGSIFGEVGMKAHNQKTFDSLLVNRLAELKTSPWIIIEGESKRVGKVVLPDFVTCGKESAVQIFVELPLKERVRHIIEEYKPAEFGAELLEAFRKIKERIHTPVAKEIEASLLSQDYAVAASLLLEHYYDPRYGFAMDQYGMERIVIKAETVLEALDEVKKVLPASRT